GKNTLNPAGVADDGEYLVINLTRLPAATATATVNFNVVAAPTNVAVSPATGTFGGTTTLVATLDSSVSGNPLAGETIAFALAGVPVGTAITDANGIATLNNVSLAGFNAGSVTIAASFAGDTTNSSSSGTGTLIISQASQTITFGPLTGKT